MGRDVFKGTHNTSQSEGYGLEKYNGHPEIASCAPADDRRLQAGMNG
jgi:hypothetical protein